MMKLLISLLTCGILGLGISFQSTAQNHTERKDKATTGQQITLQIEGMACSMCEQNCKKSLEKVEGVNVESISARKGIAKITYTGTESISDKKLKEAVENAGYKLKKVKRNETDDSDGSYNR